MTLPLSVNAWPAATLHVCAALSVTGAAIVAWTLAVMPLEPSASEYRLLASGAIV